MTKVKILINGKEYIDGEYENVEISHTRKVSPVFGAGGVEAQDLEVERGSEKISVIMS